MKEIWVEAVIGHAYNPVLRLTRGDAVSTIHLFIYTYSSHVDVQVDSGEIKLGYLQFIFKKLKLFPYQTKIMLEKVIKNNNKRSRKG